MNIKGLEKVSLVDYDGKICCTVFTGGCNLRCPFCHNSGLVTGVGGDTIPVGDVLHYIEKRRGLIDAVCVSGGEPSLQPDLEGFLRTVKAQNLLVKLDTNGTRPETLERLIANNLVDYFAMDIKNGADGYNKTAGVTVRLDDIRRSIKLVMSSGVGYEFRTTLVAELHSSRDIHGIAELIDGAEKYFLQRYADDDNCIEHGFSEVPLTVAETYADIVRPHVKSVALRGYGAQSDR